MVMQTDTVQQLGALPNHSALTDDLVLNDQCTFDNVIVAVYNILFCMIIMPNVNEKDVYFELTQIHADTTEKKEAF